MLLLIVVLLCVIGFKIYGFVQDYLHPYKKIEAAQAKDIELSPDTVKKEAIKNIVALSLVVVAALCVFLLFYTGVLGGTTSNNKSNISEKQMNDMGYYKEDGKWNYEGDGVNDRDWNPDYDPEKDK